MSAISDDIVQNLQNTIINMCSHNESSLVGCDGPDTTVFRQYLWFVSSEAQLYIY